MTAFGTVERDGFTLDWVREGTGIPMLIVGPPRYYQPVFPDGLRRTFEMVFGNMRGFAPSPEGFDVTTMTHDTYADDIEAVRLAAGLERPVVVGHSIAGTMVLEYARRYPDSVRGVVAIGSPPVGTQESSSHVGKFFDQDADTERRAAHERNFTTRRVPPDLTSGQDFADLYVANGAIYWYDPTFDASPFWAAVDPNADILMHTYTALFGDYQLQPLDTPVFLALGRYDYAIPYYLWDDERQQRLSRLHYKLYEKSGHYPPYEEPRQFTADITAWATSL